MIDARRARIKGFVFLALGLGGVVLIQSIVSWMGDPLGRLIQLGVVLIAGVGILGAARLLGVVETDANVPMSVLAAAAGIAMGDLAQHAVAFTLMPVLAWLAGLVICLGVIADLLDMEIPEAALIAFAVYGVKLVLRWTVFQS